MCAANLDRRDYPRAAVSERPQHMQLDVFKGEAHGGTVFFQYEPAIEFLIGDGD